MLDFRSKAGPFHHLVKPFCVSGYVFKIRVAVTVGYCHRHRIDKYLDTLLANQPISEGEANDHCKSLRRKMADCPS